MLPSGGTFTGWRERLTNLKKFNKEKSYVLHMRRSNSGDQYVLDYTQRESSSAEKKLRALVDTELNMSQ